MPCLSRYASAESAVVYGLQGGRVSASACSAGPPWGDGGPTPPRRLAPSGFGDSEIRGISGSQRRLLYKFTRPAIRAESVLVKSTGAMSPSANAEPEGCSA